MNFSAMFDYSEDAEVTATQVAEACLSPISHGPPTPEAGGWVGGDSLLNDAFCLSPSPAPRDHEQLREAFHKQKARADELEADLERLRDYAVRMEAEFNRVRDRAMDIILSRTAEVDRLKKELAATKKRVVLSADAPEFMPDNAVSGHILSSSAGEFYPAVRPQTLKEAVLARLKERGIAPCSNN